METKDPKNSVHENEQFGKNAENLNEAIGKSQDASPEERHDEIIDSAKEGEVSNSADDQHKKGDQGSGLMDSGSDENIERDPPGISTEEPDKGKEQTSGFEENDVLDISESEEDGHTAMIEDTDLKKEGEDQAGDANIEDDNDQSIEVEEDEENAESFQRKKDEDAEAEARELINYALLSKPDLLEILKELLDSGRINEIGPNVSAIKSSFYKQHRNEVEEKKAVFLKNGGNEEDFSPGFSEEEDHLKILLKKYSDLKAENMRLREDEKNENLRKKYEIIEEIKELVHGDESINKTFQEFRELQKRWHETGVVPQVELKNLWETYHYHVEKFYDYIKINKELRDLDLKKNLEIKISLCEKAEALFLEPNVVNAFKSLQKFHDQWREIGPVPKEQRTEIWERFREATSKINKKHQQYYHDLKETQRKNLESKMVLCERAEEIAALEITEHETWVERTHEIIDLQKVWKTIGFAPKKDNNKIYARFRAACDAFFNRKREYYAQGLEEQQDNLQKKLDLCIQAETFKESTDWKKTTDELILLQKKWKKIGPVPRKKSDQVWKRFRAACDHFFNRKSEFFSNIEDTYDKNLNEKLKLIEEINAFEPEESLKNNLNQLNDFQRKWSEIGFVPFEKKDEIMQQYRDAINNKYDSLEMDEHKKNILKFKNKLEDIKSKPRPQNKLRFEREKLMNRLQQLKNDIVVWENNIGFFAESKKADTMVREFEKKIESARRNIKLLEDKILMIDEMDG